MNKEIERAIKLLASKIDDNIKSNDALKFTQAALNLAHTKQIANRQEDSKIQK